MPLDKIKFLFRSTKTSNGFVQARINTERIIRGLDPLDFIVDYYYLFGENFSFDGEVEFEYTFASEFPEYRLFSESELEKIFKFGVATQEVDDLLYW